MDPTHLFMAIVIAALLLVCFARTSKTDLLAYISGIVRGEWVKKLTKIIGEDDADTSGDDMENDNTSGPIHNDDPSEDAVGNELVQEAIESADRFKKQHHLQLKPPQTLSNPPSLRRTDPPTIPSSADHILVPSPWAGNRHSSGSIIPARARPQAQPHFSVLVDRNPNIMGASRYQPPIQPTSHEAAQRETDRIRKRREQLERLRRWSREPATSPPQIDQM